MNKKSRLASHRPFSGWGLCCNVLSPIGYSRNALTVESFIHELAHMAQKDLLGFRLDLLQNHQRARRVLEVANEKAGWAQPLGKKEGRGVAQHFSFGSCVAKVAEVSVDRKGKIEVHRVVCAVDCGLVVNSDIVQVCPPYRTGCRKCALCCSGLNRRMCRPEAVDNLQTRNPERAPQSTPF
jgi:hypothetical protein